MDTIWQGVWSGEATIVAWPNYIGMLKIWDFESVLDLLDCNLGQFEGVVNGEHWAPSPGG